MHRNVHSHLQYAALKILSKFQWLLIEWIQSLSRRCRFRFLYTLLSVYQINFYVGRCNKILFVDENKIGFKTLLFWSNYVCNDNIPGNTLLPCLAWRSLARTTSTSRYPLVCLSASWTSPSDEAPSTCLPTNCPGPRPSMNSLNWPPSPAILRLGDQLPLSKKINAQTLDISRHILWSLQNQ